MTHHSDAAQGFSGFAFTSLTDPFQARPDLWEPWDWGLQGQDAAAKVSISQVSSTTTSSTSSTTTATWLHFAFVIFGLRHPLSAGDRGLRQLCHFTKVTSTTSSTSSSSTSSSTSTTPLGVKILMLCMFSPQSDLGAECANLGASKVTVRVSGFRLFPLLMEGAELTQGYSTHLGNQRLDG